MRLADPHYSQSGCFPIHGGGLRTGMFRRRRQPPVWGRPSEKCACSWYGYGLRRPRHFTCGMSGFPQTVRAGRAAEAAVFRRRRHNRPPALEGRLKNGASGYGCGCGLLGLLKPAVSKRRFGKHGFACPQRIFRRHRPACHVPSRTLRLCLRTVLLPAVRVRAVRRNPPYPRTNLLPTAGSSTG